MDKKTSLQIEAIRSLYPSLFKRYEFKDSEILAFVSRCPDFSYRLYLLENNVKLLNFFQDVILPIGDKYDLERYCSLCQSSAKIVYSMTNGIWLPF